jgi:Uma2 family endonuclease
MATRVILTYLDYAALPDDGRRYEVHEGELAVTPAPGPVHQELIGNLFALLHAHVKDRRLGKVFLSPIDCVLDDTTVVQPDLLYVEARRLSIVSRRGIEGPPDLVVEVLSPSTLQIDRTVKLQLYGRHGVPHYWIADIDRRVIEAFALAGGAYEIAARLEGTHPAALPPFTDLALGPALVWP